MSEVKHFTHDYCKKEAYFVSWQSILIQFNIINVCVCVL